MDPGHTRIPRIETKRSDHGHGREVTMDRVPDAPRTLAVNHFEAIGTSQQRPVDLIGEACKRLFDDEAV